MKRFLPAQAVKLCGVDEGLAHRTLHAFVHRDRICCTAHPPGNVEMMRFRRCRQEPAAQPLAAPYRRFLCPQCLRVHPRFPKFLSDRDCDAAAPRRGTRGRQAARGPTRSRHKPTRFHDEVRFIDSTTTTPIEQVWNSGCSTFPRIPKLPRKSKSSETRRRLGPDRVRGPAWEGGGKRLRSGWKTTAGVRAGALRWRSSGMTIERLKLACAKVRVVARRSLSQRQRLVSPLLIIQSQSGW